MALHTRRKKARSVSDIVLQSKVSDRGFVSSVAILCDAAALGAAASVARPTPLVVARLARFALLNVGVRLEGKDDLVHVANLTIVPAFG